MFRSLRLSLRFLLPLALAMLGLAYLAVPVVDTLTLRWFMRDLDTRSSLIGKTLGDDLAEALRAQNPKRVDVLLDRVATDERVFALAVCTLNNTLLRSTSTLPSEISCRETGNNPPTQGRLISTRSGPLHLAVSEIRHSEDQGKLLGRLLIVHDMSFVERRSEDTRTYVLLLFALLGIAVSMISVLVAHLSWRGWMAGVRAMLRGEGVIKPFSQPNPELAPLVGDLRNLLRDVQRERVHDDSTQQWNAEGLRRLIRQQFRGDQVILVSNREPYIHTRSTNGIKVQRPASGLVTGVEPVMQACAGTWIAHGSGSADRETVDKRDHVRVPPSQPSYTLRRLWLSKEEEAGYYYGFANEGLWPLCHIAHVRPIFRSEDWEQYRRVNERFADAVYREAQADDPIVLVQDYHFALLPRLVRERLPRATIISFWHIPWPNPESFGICPWRQEIIDGLLGSTTIGFHTRYHCNNFLQTVDRFLETRIEYENSTISFGGQLTQVQSYPISIGWPEPEALGDPVPQCRAEIRQLYGLDPEHLVGIGVDRLDYTKGITERLRAVERLLRDFPQWRGRFTFVQIAAPTRSSLDEYQRLEADVREIAAKINTAYGSDNYQPIRLVVEHHDHAAVTRHFRAADVCVVTSLHDGMNLVAKEFIAARDDERGVLILSQFAGAAQELPEALIVNPYHVEQVTEALQRALSMSDVEQRERMRSLRQLVREFNVYRWAGRMLLDASRLRRRERIMARIEDNAAVT